MPARYEDLLKDLTTSLATLREASERTGGASEDEVWVAYATMERLAAVLKLRMGLDRPGVLEVLPKSKNPEEFIGAALASAEDAERRLKKGELEEALGSIREARTSLRAYLAEKNRARLRDKRKARSASRPSTA